ncbi:conserved exported hypothetical protein [Hyella patelloides LEGE 07179]|uniref:Carboxypeptidase regulatory-like domain-containing protein n=1 Tax=Hyella patelloides LEGE 07179 TaxID=945734 RepID=A0A563VQQ1_9CYAN|nr:carboxypeptidase regulatory-like domain-containing protein [Hyella patelloides]VEP13597.1 conserved exported hypothetical protein [Hyella patelloides LEGE 07179]
MKDPRILLFLLFSSGFAQPVYAHGARIDYQQTSAIVIRATYDDGTPMAKAQAVVYAPDDPSTPWLKGMTDESGKFTFVPDAELSGNWDVKVRQAGHGDLVSIPLEQDAIAESSTTATMNSSMSATDIVSYSPGQKLLMAISGVWGFIGTALFFYRK